MKKTFLFGMIALLSVSFVFMGCPDGGEDAKSDAKAISTVLTVAPVAVTGAPAEGKDGTTAEKAKPYTVTLPIGTTGNVAVTNIAVSANATPALYSEATFATEAPAAGILLAAAGTPKDVYVKVTAQDNSVAYYKVSITISLQPQIATVLDVAPEAVTGDAAAGKDGTTAEKAKPYTVTLPVGTTGNVAVGNIVSTITGAKVVLYSDDGFATEASTAGIALAAAGTAKDVYVKVTANEIVAYYKVSITITAPSTDAGLTSVLGEDITATGTGTSSSPKTATITLTASTADKSAVGSGAEPNIAAATGATVALYTASDFSGTAAANVSIPAGATTPVYIKVTAEDGTPLHYKVSIVYPKTVTSYSLKAGETSPGNTNAAASGVSLTSATELDGKVTLKLGGTVTGEYILKAVGTTGSATVTVGSKFENASGDWLNGADTKPEAGTYGAVYVKGLVDWTDSATTKILAIKHTNHAIRLYAGNNSDEFLTSSPAKPWIISAISTKTIFMPSSATELPVKWRLYSAIPKDDTFGILIWDGGASSLTPKTAKLEIQEYDGYVGSPGSETTSAAKTDGYSKTVIVDYSAVTFASTATP